MVILAACGLLAAGGVGVYASWDKYSKPFILKTAKEKIIPKQITKVLKGSACEIRDLQVTLDEGKVYVKIEGIDVGNLPPYQSKSLVVIEFVEAHVDVAGFVRSCFKKIPVQHVHVDGVKLTMEKNIDITTSNIKELLAKMKTKDEAQDDQQPGQVDWAQSASDLKNSTVSGATNLVNDTSNTLLSLAPFDGSQKEMEDATKDKPQEAPKAKGKGPKVHVGKLIVSNCSVNTVTTMMVENNIGGMGVPVPKINIEDFSAKYGEQPPARMVQALLGEIYGAAGNAVAASGVALGEELESTAGWLWGFLTSWTGT
mmetsp:Transcript_90619/g.161381  ORF Transcript_90619/g.161381 Transcript_90619/m.161381 type:complete len:313 (+) Transcript_90619:33-971(+)